MMTLLLSHGADKNAVKIQTRTSESYQGEFMITLIPETETPLDVVERLGFEDAQTYLKKQVARSADDREAEASQTLRNR